MPKTVRRHVTLPYDLVEQAHALKGISLSKLMSRGLDLALAEQRGAMLVRAPEPEAKAPPPPPPPTTPTPSPAPAPAPAKVHHRIEYTNPHGLELQPGANGEPVLPARKLCRALGILYEDLAIELDDEDLTHGDDGEIAVGPVGINTALAVASRKGVDEDFLDGFERWFTKQIHTTTT